MTGTILYLQALENDGGAVQEITDRLREAGFGVERCVVPEHKPEEALLAFVVADDAYLKNAAQKKEMMHIVIDDNPPKYSASARNVVYINPSDITNNADGFEESVEKIISHLLGDASAGFLEFPDDPDVQRRMNSIRQREDDENARIEAEQKLEARRNRLMAALNEDIWGGYLDLIKDDNWDQSSALAYASARIAANRARAAAHESVDQLGKSFGHAHRGGAVEHHFWGRGKFYSGSRRQFIYEGETDGVDPHGFGVMTFSPTKMYLGEFVRGVKSGMGIAYQDQLAWFGNWREDHPHGAGVFGIQISERRWQILQGDVLEELKDKSTIEIVFKMAKGTFSGVMNRIGIDL